MVVAGILPVLLLAPVAGPLVDRWPRVRVMIRSDLARIVLAVVLARWHDAPVAVYVIAFAMFVGGVFFNPAAASVLPALVREDALVAANSGIWTAAVLSQIVLAPVAGILRWSWYPPGKWWRLVDLPGEPGDLPVSIPAARRPHANRLHCCAGCGSERPDPHLDVAAAKTPRLHVECGSLEQNPRTCVDIRPAQ